MEHFKSRRTKILLAALVGTAIIPVAFAFSTSSIFGDSTAVFGPLSCPGCRGQTPIPDVATDAFLRKYTLDTNRERFGTHKEAIRAGAKIIVCNASYCTTYQLTESNDWNAINQETIKIPPSQPSRGGGGGGGGGRGSPIGSPAPGSGGGGDIKCPRCTVTVG